MKKVYTFQLADFGLSKYQQHARDQLWHHSLQTARAGIPYLRPDPQDGRVVPLCHHCRYPFRVQVSAPPGQDLPRHRARPPSGCRARSPVSSHGAGKSQVPSLSRSDARGSLRRSRPHNAGIQGGAHTRHASRPAMDAASPYPRARAGIWCASACQIPPVSPSATAAGPSQGGGGAAWAGRHHKAKAARACPPVIPTGGASVWTRRGREAEVAAAAAAAVSASGRR